MQISRSQPLHQFGFGKVAWHMFDKVEVDVDRFVVLSGILECFGKECQRFEHMFLKGHVCRIESTLGTFELVKELQQVASLFLLFVDAPCIGCHRDDKTDDNNEQYAKKRIVVCGENVFHYMHLWCSEE